MTHYEYMISFLDIYEKFTIIESHKKTTLLSVFDVNVASLELQ